jgi:hypothetical protein
LIKRIVQRLRQVWPKTRFIVRGDSGFCRPAALRRFERWDVHYIIGLPQNAVLLRQFELAEPALADAYEAIGTLQQRAFLRMTILARHHIDHHVQIGVLHHQRLTWQSRSPKAAQ